MLLKKPGYSMSRDGIPLGYMLDEREGQPGRWRKLKYSGGRHLITVAPAGSGKGTCAIIPALLEYDASCLVVDPKGELAAVTARQRRRMGHEIIILNPFYELQDEFMRRGFPRPHRFNPLAELRPPPPAASEAAAMPSSFAPADAHNYWDFGFVADTARLAEALVFNQTKDPHWPASARVLAECLIMFVCTEPGEERSLRRVRELLVGAPDELVQAIAKMKASSYWPLRQKVGQFLAAANEIMSVRSTNADGFSRRSGDCRKRERQ
jgi:type IV secretion system protein VirD4